MRKPASSPHVVGIHDGGSCFHCVQDGLLFGRPKPQGLRNDPSGTPGCRVFFTTLHGLEQQDAALDPGIEGGDPVVLQASERQLWKQVLQQLVRVVLEVLLEDVTEVLAFSGTDVGSGWTRSASSAAG